MRWKFSVVFFVLAIFMRCTVNGEEPEREENSLIPRNLIPLQYNLLFEVDMTDEMNLFTGTATIKIQCIQPTKQIILNMKGLEIDKNDVKVTKVVRKSRSCLRIIPLPRSCSFPRATSSTETIMLDIESQGYNKEIERYMIILQNELKKRDIVIVVIKYRKLSSLQHPDVAFIKYSYRGGKDGEEKWLAVSRSGAIHARRLYPCIDERDLRAPVTVMIYYDGNLIGLSNTLSNQVSTFYPRKLPGFIVKIHEPTNGLSTFSIGFVVGDFIRTSTPNIPLANDVRIWIDKSVADKTTYMYATITAPTVFNYYQTYFNSERQGCEIDIVALPNYGYIDKWMLDLITLDASVIADHSPTKEFRKFRQIEIAFQLCDVFSHQYFGPQTTTSKWSEHWLNMGLALFFRTPCFDHIFPKEKSSLAIIDLTESFIRISDADPGRIFHPLTLSDSQINLNTLFEDSALADIAYILVRMLNSIVSKSKDILYKGVKKYIANSKTKVFNLKDILNLFKRSRYSYHILNEPTILTVMNSWTSTNAIPIIKLTRGEGKKTVTVTQEPLETDNYENNVYKYIPLIYATKSDLLDSRKKRRVRKWLKDESQTITDIQDDEWVIHNSRLDVLCRYVYDKSILNLIKKTLSSQSQFTIIPDLARAQLISDLFAITDMYEYPDYNYSTVFGILKYLEHERSLPPLMVALHEFNKIRLRILGSDAFDLFQEYVQHILQIIIKSKQYENITEFGENDYTDYYLKKLIIATACTFQVKTYVDQSTDLFNKWLVESERKSEEESGGKSEKENKIISPFPEIVRQYIYCQAIRKGGEKEWTFLWKLYDKKNAGKSDDILNALACTADCERLKLYLKWSIEADKIAPEDSLTVFKSVGTNVQGYPLMYEFLRNNLKEISAANNGNLSNRYAYWKLLYEITWNRKDFHKLEIFTNSPKRSVQFQNMKNQLQESREKAKMNILWTENKGGYIINFLKSWKKQDKEEISVE